MIQWSGQACIDGKPAPLASCRGMVTRPTNVKYALSRGVVHLRPTLDTYTTACLYGPPTSSTQSRFYRIGAPNVTFSAHRT
jgi:hypothetical protein